MEEIATIDGQKKNLKKAEALKKESWRQWADLSQNLGHKIKPNFCSSLNAWLEKEWTYISPDVTQKIDDGNIIPYDYFCK